MEPVRIYGTAWCPDCRRAEQFLKERGVPLEEIDIDESPDAEELVLRVNDGLRKVPTFDRNGEFFSCSPFDPYFLAQKFGVPLNPAR